MKPVDTALDMSLMADLVHQLTSMVSSFDSPESSGIFPYAFMLRIDGILMQLSGTVCKFDEMKNTLTSTRTR